MLLGALKPLTSLPQERYPVHQAMLFALVRLADKTCKPCEDKLTKQIERDEKAVRLPGARGLLAETRVALAIIQNTEPGGARPREAAAGGHRRQRPPPTSRRAKAAKKGKSGARPAGLPRRAKGKGEQGALEPTSESEEP